MQNVVFANEEIYHIFNRGIEKRPTFTDKREYSRAVLTIDFYRFANLPLRLSKALLLNQEERERLFTKIRNESKKLVDVICFCLMPNHFHFLLRQKMDNGISKFLKNLSDSYTRYFNTKHQNRNGALFQGTFKAVRIEDEEQLLHVHRYIHINPLVSFVVREDEVEDYRWSSFPEYLGLGGIQMCERETILSHFNSINRYRQFIFDQVDYARKLESIKHLIFE